MFKVGHFWNIRAYATNKGDNENWTSIHRVIVNCFNHKANSCSFSLITDSDKFLQVIREKCSTHRPHIQPSGHDNRQSSAESSTSRGRLLVSAGAAVMMAPLSGVVNKVAASLPDCWRRLQHRLLHLYASLQPVTIRHNSRITRNNRHTHHFYTEHEPIRR